MDKKNFLKLKPENLDRRAFYIGSQYTYRILRACNSYHSPQFRHECVMLIPISWLNCY